MLPRVAPTNNSPMQQISTTSNQSPNAESPAQTAHARGMALSYGFCWPILCILGSKDQEALLVRFERTDEFPLSAHLCPFAARFDDRRGIIQSTADLSKMTRSTSQ
jgi:hypothetical protein